VLNESRKRGGMKKKIEMKQAALFVNPNESRKSTKVKKRMAVIDLDLI
jgi:hypothetical protein